VCIASHTPPPLNPLAQRADAPRVIPIPDYEVVTLEGQGADEDITFVLGDEVGPLGRGGRDVDSHEPSSGQE